jgi:hypothetical protein
MNVSSSSTASQIAASSSTVHPATLRVALQQGTTRGGITITLLVSKANLTALDTLFFVFGDYIDDDGNPFKGYVSLGETDEKDETPDPEPEVTKPITMSDGIGTVTTQIAVVADKDAVLGIYRGNIGVALLADPVELQMVPVTIVVKASIKLAYLAVCLGVITSFLWSVYKFSPSKKPKKGTGAGSGAHKPRNS